jgi:WD40 repeat protein
VSEYSGIRRRQLVVIATAEYKELGKLDVHHEVEIIQRWLTDGELAERGFERIHHDLARDPTKNQIRDALEDPPVGQRWSFNDAAVVYITGHGEVLDNGPDSQEGQRYQHFLVLKNTEGERLRATGLATNDLFSWLADTKIEHLLVIVDACFAGQVADYVTSLARDRWLILPAAAKRQTAQLGALAESISEYLKRGDEFNRNDPYLKVGMFVEALNQFLTWDQRINHIYKGRGPSHDPDYRPESDPHLGLPNPHYDPRDELVETDAPRRDLALPKVLLELHQRGGGQSTAIAPPAGWLFTGRGTLARELIDAAGQPGVTMVTGSAGSGKSTALARLVTLSDPSFQSQYAEDLAGMPADLLPSLGAVDVALSAEELSSRQVVAQICHDLDIPVKTTSWQDPVQVYRRELGNHLSARRAPLTIVLDALDKAKNATDLIQNVLVPLREQHSDWLCLILGVRSPGAEAGTTGGVSEAEEALPDLVVTRLRAERIQVDDDDRWSLGDFTTFIRNILTNTPGSPYREASPTAVVRAAKVISGLSGRSYLMAERAADYAATRDAVIAPDDPDWLDALKRGVLGVFQQDLADSLKSAEERRTGVALLRAVAFARGNGLPWNRIWATVANAVAEVDGADRQYGDSDVRELLKSRLNAYLKTGREDDLTVYRLMHDQLRDTLRYRWRELLDPAATQQADEAEIQAVEARITRALHRQAADVQPTIAVDQAPAPYARRYLTEHAVAGGVLGRLQMPSAFLPYLDLARLRTAVGTSPDRRRLGRDVPWLRVARQVTHLWDWDWPAGNAAAIEMWAALNEITLPREEETAFRPPHAGPDPGPVGGPWQVHWAVRPPDTSDLLGRHEEIVQAAATAELSGVPIVVTGSADGQLRIWDQRTGGHYLDREPIQLPGGGIQSVTTTRLPDGQIVAAAGCADGRVRLWDLQAGGGLGELLVSSEAIEAVTATVLPGGSVVLATADRSGNVRTWDLVRREPIGGPVPCGPGRALGLTAAVVGGQVLGLATGRDSGVQLWDLSTGDRVGGRLTGHPRAQQSGAGTEPGGRAIAAAVLDGREVVLTGNSDGLLVWDLRNRAPMGVRLASSIGEVRSVAVAQLPDGQVIAVTGGTRAVQVWDLSAGQPIGDPLTGHTGAVGAVALLMSPDGSVVAVTASQDKSVRTWEVPGAALSAARASSQQLGAVEAVTTARAAAEGPAIAISCSRAVVQVWDLEHGGEPALLDGYDSPVVSVTAAPRPDGALIVAGHWDGWITAWSAADGRLVSCAEIGDLGTAAALATAELAGGRIVTVAGGWDGGVRVWDPLTGAPAGPALPGHAAAVVAIATAPAEGRTLVISGSTDGQVRIRDLGAHLDPGLLMARRPVDAGIEGKVASLTTTTLADGRACAVVGAEDGTVYLLDLLDGGVIGQPWPACADAVTAVAAGRLEDGRVAVFTGSTDALIQAWDASTGQPLGAALPAPGAVLALAFDLELSSLVIGGTGVAVARPNAGRRSRR